MTAIAVAATAKAAIGMVATISSHAAIPVTIVAILSLRRSPDSQKHTSDAAVVASEAFFLGHLFL